jgi:hypothetical protein
MLIILCYRLTVLLSAILFLYFSTNLPTESEKFRVVSLGALVAVYTLFEGGIAQTIMRIVSFNYEQNQDASINIQKKILVLRNQALILMFLISITILFLSFRLGIEGQEVNNFYTSIFVFAISISARLYAEMLVSYIEGMQKVETAYTLRLLASIGMLTKLDVCLSINCRCDISNKAQYK